MSVCREFLTSFVINAYVQMSIWVNKKDLLTNLINRVDR